jgi:rhodanese-related sulfurtransferase
MRVWRMAVLVGVGVGLGFAWNAVSGRGLALTKNVLVKPGDEEIEAAEAKARLDKGALVLDARPIAFYEMSHIAGAVPLPEDDFDKAFAKLEPTLRSRFDIVVYCEAFCEASHIVARKLKERGIPAVIVKDGWMAWQDAGYPVAAGGAP